MFIPKKFLCRFPLNIGAVVTGIVTLCLLIICAIVIICQIVYILDCTDCASCKVFALRNCYAYSITGLIYILITIACNIWFFFGIKQKKSSVVLSWIVVYLLWLVLVFVILIILLFLFASDVHNSLKAIVAIIFGLIAIALLVYGILVVAAFWLEMKQSKQRQPESP